MLRLRFRYGVLAAAGVAVLGYGCGTATPDPSQLRTPEERFSYALGAKLGDDLRASGHEVDSALVLRGVEDGLTGRATLSKEEIGAALAQGVAQQNERRATLRAERAEQSQAEGRAFLASNRARPGVVELPSGLQYEVLHAGTGPVPTIEDFVDCNYRATLLAGTVFDDTASLGRPRNFAVTSVIDGFEEALLRMPTGSHWKLYIPPELAYGAAGARSKIPPYATLIFDVELVSIAAPPRR